MSVSEGTTVNVAPQAVFFWTIAAVAAHELTLLSEMHGKMDP